MKAEESKQFVRRCTLGAAGGAFMAAGDWLLGCIPIEETDTGMFNRAYPHFKADDFESLRGRIQILLPEKDIFKKEDQNRFADLFRKLDAEIHNVPGGHVGFIVQSGQYIDLMKPFLQKNGI